MIVPMKKVSLLILDSEKNEALIKLQNLGLIHLNDIQGSSEKLTAIQAERDMLFRSISLLPDTKDKKVRQIKYSKEETLEIAKRIIRLNEEIKVLSDAISSTKGISLGTPLIK